jgi:ligand-binding sensor domain-containing protein/signal transduction histidine kinase
LPQNTVNCMLQDKYGFIWIGTQDGLSKFDGYTFKNYYHDIGNPNSLSNNYIWDIHEDEAGVLWISSFGGGITRFDPGRETFKHYKRDHETDSGLSTNNTFKSIRIADDLWVGTNNGLCKIDLKTENVSCFYSTAEVSDGNAGNYVGSIAFEAPDILWAGSDQGLIRFDLSDQTSEIFTHSMFGENLDLTRIRDLHALDDKLLILTTRHLLEIDFRLQTEQVIVDPEMLSLNVSPGFSKVYMNNGGHFFLGSTKGLVEVKKNTNEITIYKHDDKHPNSLPNDDVKCLLRSEEGVLWVATKTGIGLVNKIESDFKHVFRREEDENHQKLNVIKSILELKDNRVLIGSTGGLYYYDRNTKAFSDIPSELPGNVPLQSSYILSLEADQADGFWVGSLKGGLLKLTSNQISGEQSFVFNKTGVQGITIQSILNAGDYLWLGSSGSGLIKYNKINDTYKVYNGLANGLNPSHPYVFYVFEDSRSNLWLGTATGGLNLFDEDSGRFIYIKNHTANPSSLSNDLVLCIFEDSKNQLWVGTASGLNKLTIPLTAQIFDQLYAMEAVNEAPLFQSYNRKSGFPNDVIYGILEDDAGFLWLSTNQGLIQFDPEKGEVVRLFDQRDGLQSNEHNQNSFYKNQNGEFYFGGMNGFNIFNPADISSNTYIPPVYVTDFKLYNESVKLSAIDNEPDFHIDLNPYLLKEVKLKHHHKVVSFEFAALNFLNASKNKYAYMLEGFDKNWNQAGTNRSATYTNLNPGEYYFKVLASNNDDVWNTEGVALKLIIPPPPWLSWYAYMFYAIVFMLGIYLLIRIRIKAATQQLKFKAQLEEARILERERFRQKSAQDFHDEAGNKITKINLFTTLAQSQAEDPEKLQRYLSKIELNAVELAAGMRDFLWSMDSEKDSLYDLFLRLKEFGESMFLDAGIKFSMDGFNQDLVDIRTPMKFRRSILQLFKEGMNNTLKYSDATQVSLALQVRDNLLSITYTDNGKGFDLNDNGNLKGYGLKNMNHRAEQAGGSLSIQTSPGSGTKIVFNCNITHMGD